MTLAQTAVNRVNDNLRGVHLLFIGALLLAGLVLTSTVPLSFSSLLRAALAAAVTIFPWGWLLVRLLTPGVRSASARFALVVLAGYACSVLLGFMLGVMGLGRFYVPLSAAVTLVILLYLAWANLRDAARRAAASGGISAYLSNQSVWIVLSIALLSVAAASPLMAPLVRVTPTQYIDYSYIDTFFQAARAHVLQDGAPAATSPDLAGVKPVVYPDYHNFWLSQIARWANSSIRDTYRVLVPILSVLFYALLGYAVGKALTGSAWGGYLGSALAFIFFIPNPYDSNFLLRIADTYPDYTATAVHFADLRGNLSYGVAWSLISGTVLCLALLREHRTDRTGIGLLVLAALLTAVQLRIRSHYFLVLAPAFVLLCAGLALRWRNLRLLIPIAVFVGLFGLIYWESTRSWYESASTDLGFVYGTYGEFAINYLPRFMRPFLSSLPDAVRPIINQTLVVLLRYFGVAYLIVMGYWVWQLARRRMRLAISDWFILGAMAITFGASMFVVLGVYRDLAGGSWAPQALTIFGPLAMLLAIVPAYHLLRSIVHSQPFLRENQTALGLVALLLCAFITYRAANVTLHDQSQRAYLLTPAELDAYYWLRVTTPRQAVVAASPAHAVNVSGETILKNNFLSGMTERSAYVERIEGYHTDIAQARVAQLQALFAARTPEQVRQALNGATFDYLLVYPDTPTATDLSCCMKQVWDGTPAVFQRAP